MDTVRTDQGPRRWRVLIRWLVLITFLAALYLGGHELILLIEEQFKPWYEVYGRLALVLIVTLYILLMALPFVPGIEISLALLMIFGVEGVGLVYGSTLAALTLSFLVGRLVPLRIMGRLMAWLHLQRASKLVERLNGLDGEGRLHLLVDAAPLRFIPFLLRHRYLAVAVAFNLPGNALIGGGGGIALTAGMSGLFRIPAYVLMVALAISPIPTFLLAKAVLFPAG